MSTRTRASKAPAEDRFGVERGPEGVTESGMRRILYLLGAGRISRPYAKDRYGLDNETLNAFEIKEAIEGPNQARRRSQRRRPREVRQTVPVVLNLGDIPLPGRGRFTPKVKKDIIVAIEDGVGRKSFTLAEALAHCGISEHEYALWRKDLSDYGLEALGIRRLQQIPRRSGIGRRE